MERKDSRFWATFIASLAIMVFFLGSSIAGYVVYETSMYCENGVCKGFCYYDEDCTGNQVCCLKLNFGVCEPKPECDTPFELEPTYSMYKPPSIESPRPGTTNQLQVFVVLIVLIVGVGIAYAAVRNAISKRKS